MLAFNILQADGALVGHKEVESQANDCDIYVRIGSLCNPGGFATHLEWNSENLRQAHDGGHRCSNPKQFIFGKSTGVVRVSLGASSTVSDVHTFVRFVRKTYMSFEEH